MAGPAAEAYIIMRADGTLLPRDVKSFAKDAGEETGEQFADGFEEEWSKASERSMKDFEKRIGKALETSDFDGFRKKGESIDKMFVRLGGTLEDLNREGKLSDRVFEGFFEHFDEYMNISATNEQVKAYATYSDAARKSEEKRAASVTNLGRKMEDLSIRQREWMDRQIEMAELSGNWDPFIKKMGGAEKALERLGARTDEVRKANVAYGDSMDHLEESLIDWIDVAKKRQADEEAALAQAEASEKQRKATEDLANTSKKALDRAVEGRKRLIRSNSTLQRDLNKLKGASDRALDALIVKSRTTGSWSELNHHVNDAADTIDHVRTRSERLEATTDAVSQRLRVLRDNAALTEEDFRDLTDAFAKYEREQRKIIDAMDETSVQQERARIIHQSVNRTVKAGHGDRDKFILQLGNIGDRAGRTFGKGGRNDVLHFFGTLVGGITKFALQTPAKVFNVASDGVKTFQKSFQQLTQSVSEGGAGMSKMPAAFSSMGAAASAMAPMIASGAAGLVAFSMAAGALASLISLLVGNLVILGQTLYLSVAAPLLAMVPAIAGFAAGAVVAGGAIYKWSQQSSAFKSAMSGISDELDKLAKKITPAMDGLSRLFGKAGQSMVQSFSGAVTRVLNDLYRRLDHPSMDKFYRAWSESMPRAFESLGKAATSFITGLTAFFVPILPYAERLAEAIRRAADRFSEWAKSASGQNAIASWMKTAWEVAVDLWTGLKDIWVALRNVFGLATGSGGNFAKWVRDIGERFKEWTESEEGRKAIKQWLEDAEDLAKDLWDIITDLAESFDELDSEEGRAALEDFLDLFKALATVARVFSTVMNAVNTVVGPIIDYLSYGIGVAADNLNNLFTLDFKGFGDTYGRVMTDAYNVSAEFFGLEPADDFGDALDKSAERAQRWGSAIGEAFSDAWDAVSGWFEDLDLGGKWDSAWGALKDAVSDGVDWLSEKASDVWDAIKDWFDVDWSEVWENVKSGISDLVDRAKGWLESKGSDIADTVKGWFDIDWSGVLDSFMGFLGNMARQAGLGIGLVIGFFVKLPGRIGDGLSSAWDAISTWTSNTWDSFSTWASEVPGRIGDGLSRAKEAISTWASEAWDSISEWASNTWDSFSEWAGEVPGRIRDGLSSAKDAISNWASDTWDSIKTWTSETWDSFSTWASELPGRIGDGLTAAVEAVKEWATDMKDAVVGWWEDIEWGEIWENIKSGISDGLQSIWDWLKEQGKMLFDNFIQGIKDGLGIASPSQKMIELMGYVGEGILQGLLAIPGMIGGAISGLFQPLIDGAMALPGRVMGALSTLGSTIWTALSGVGLTIGTTVAGWWTTISSNLMSWGGRVVGALSGFVSGIASTLGTVAGRIGTTVSGWWTSISGAFMSWGGRAASALSGFISSVISTISSVGSRIGSTVSGWWSSIGTTLSSWGGKAKSALSSFGSSVKSSFDSAKTAATQKAGELVNAARGKLAEMGSKAGSALTSLGTNVKSKFDSAKSTATSAASSLVEGARSKLSTMGGKASSALSNLGSSVKSRFNSAKSAATTTASSLVSSARSTLSRMGSQASSALSNLAGQVRSKFNNARSAATSVARNLVSSARSALSRMGSAAAGALSNVAGQVRSKFNNAKNAAVSVAGQMVSSARSRLSGMASAVGGALSNVKNAITRPFQSAKDAVNRILGQIRGLANKAGSIGGSLRGKIPGFAKGGTVFGNQIARVGETGPEAIVPLNRPLHQVDPSVRWLSAIAQGKGGGGGGTTIQSGAIQVVTPYANPELVANRVLDDLVANL